MSAEERAAQQQALAEHLKSFDVVVTTAAVPGRPAPKILSAAMVEGMKPGALIVDLAAEGGGNCELTRPGERVEHGGVVILGPLNLPAGAPLHASEMYARNVYNFVELLVHDGALKPDFDDELVAKSCLSARRRESRFVAAVSGACNFVGRTLCACRVSCEIDGARTRLVQRMARAQWMRHGAMAACWRGRVADDHGRGVRPFWRCAGGSSRHCCISRSRCAGGICWKRSKLVVQALALRR